MAGPIITKLKNWFFPKKPEPPKEPEPEPTVKIDAAPSPLPAVNYIRALLILKSLPLAQLREEFFKLPLRKLGWTVGLAIWLYMSYAIIAHIFAWLLPS